MGVLLLNCKEVKIKMANYVKEKSEVIDGALTKQAKSVHDGKAGAIGALKGYAGAYNATTFGDSSGDFDPNGYGGPAIIENSLNQAEAAELRKQGKWEAYESKVRSDAFGKEVDTRNQTRQRLVLAANPDLEAKLKAANEAQKEFGKLTQEDPQALRDTVLKEIEEYAK